MWEKIGLVALGFISANIINLFEIGILLKILKDIQRMLKQFKAEGNPNKWQE